MPLDGANGGSPGTVTGKAVELPPAPQTSPDAIQMTSGLAAQGLNAWGQCGTWAPLPLRARKARGWKEP